MVVAFLCLFKKNNYVTLYIGIVVFNYILIAKLSVDKKRENTNRYDNLFAYLILNYILELNFTNRNIVQYNLF